MRTKVGFSASVRHKRRFGFTLLELVLAMALMSIALTLSMAAILGAFRIEEASSASLRRQFLLATIADQFRNDVATANAVPESLEKLSAGKSCLILRGAGGRHIIYRWSTAGLERSNEARAGEPQWQEVIGPEYGVVQFGRGEGERPVITFTLAAQRHADKVRRPFEVSAALGGDLR